MTHLSFFFLFFFSGFISSSSSNNSVDFNPLQSFRSSSDPAGLLSSWDPETDPCSGSWVGVYCHNGQVTKLVLEELRLNGTIEALARLPHLTVLSLKNNHLCGSLHLLSLSLWQPHLKLLFLSNNKFSGPFPESILHLRHLHRLDLAGNQFSGVIPASIGILLPHLLTLRLEKNLFTGEIPGSVGKIQSLVDLNVSYNHLVGEIPKNLSFSSSSFIGNLALCGNPVEDCPKQAMPTSYSDKKKKKKKKKKKHWILILFLIIIILSISAVLLAAFLIFMQRRCRTREGKGDRGSEDENPKGTKEERLVFFEGCEEFVMEDLMRGSAEMLGRGVVGSTYRVYVHRGSLYNLLHGNRGPGRIPLDWSARFKIALGAAKGLTFLHETSKSKLSHQHLTSSNILVDEDNNALISDFALHQLLAPPTLTSSSQDPIRKNTSKCDIYSFGVVLLEILTGKVEGEGEMDLVKWVQMVVREEWTAEVFDIELLRCRGMEDEMVALLQIALLCLTPDTKCRPKMSVVHKMIEDIKDRRLRRGRGSFSPSGNDSSNQSSPGISDDNATFTSGRSS
ncbi:uncharacterized protein A4U43_C08F4660 [Asparagus officinalis]|nr:uncharacterized protein A4U43_C08F4660 [Asparagus officinalis]